MLSIHCNSRIKSQRNWKKFAKNIKIRLFKSTCNLKGINYPSGKDDWKKVEKNNSAIAINVLYIENEYISCLHFKTQLKL